MNPVSKNCSKNSGNRHLQNEPIAELDSNIPKSEEPGFNPAGPTPEISILTMVSNMFHFLFQPWEAHHERWFISLHVLLSVLAYTLAFLQVHIHLRLNPKSTHLSFPPSSMLAGQALCIINFWCCQQPATPGPTRSRHPRTHWDIDAHWKIVIKNTWTTEGCHNIFWNQHSPCVHILSPPVCFHMSCHVFLTIPN